MRSTHKGMRISRLEGAAPASHLSWSGLASPKVRRTSSVRQAGGYPIRKSEVRIGAVRDFVEKAISSLKRLGAGAYRTQVRRALMHRSEGRRNSFSRRGLRGARGIRIAIFDQTLLASVQKIQNFSLGQARRPIRLPDSRLTICHKAATLSHRRETP